MSVNFERIKNFHVSIQENKGNIIFLENWFLAEVNTVSGFTLQNWQECLQK
jgi:hypothetical protein